MSSFNTASSFSGGMPAGGVPDGSVVIAAAMDTGEVRRGAEEIGRILVRMRENTMQQVSALHSGVTTETARTVSSVLGSVRTMNRGVTQAVTDGGVGVLRAAQGVMGETLSSMLDRAQQFTAVGEALVRSVAAGISDASSVTDAAARTAARSALHAMQTELGIPVTQRTDDTRYTTAAETLQTAGTPVTGAHMLRAAGIVFAQTEAAVTAPSVSTGNAVPQSGTGQPNASRQDAASGMTVIFNKPVETPAAHARALRRTVEELLHVR